MIDEALILKKKILMNRLIIKNMLVGDFDIFSRLDQDCRDRTGDGSFDLQCRCISYSNRHDAFASVNQVAGF